MANNVKGKTCLITGGAFGIGAACVVAFLREGAQFVAILDIAEEKGKALQDNLNKTYPGRVLFVKCDVSSEESIKTAFNTVVGKVKRLDIVINNAGIINDSENHWRSSCEINFLGTVSFSLKALKHMRKDQGGRGGTIINVSSMGAFSLSPEIPIYCATKAAVLYFSRGLSNESLYAATGVRVMTICFGATDTTILAGLPERVVDRSLAQTFQDALNAMKMQSTESAAAACVTMVDVGANGSVWLSQHDNPAEDITASIDEGYKTMASVLK